MEGVLGSLPAGSLSLAPTFALWAALAGALLLIGGSMAWMVAHEALARLLRRLWLADVVAVWLAYAAAYHLVFLNTYRLVLGRPLAVWLLCAALGVYLALRRLPTRLRRPDVLFALAVVIWAGVLSAGQRYIDGMDQDAALLANQPQAVLDPQAPRLRPLRRVLLLTRLEPDVRAATVQLLRGLEREAPLDAMEIATWRGAYRPRVLERYRLDLAKLRTYQWVQFALLAVVLLLFAFGQPPRDVGTGGGTVAGRS